MSITSATPITTGFPDIRIVDKNRKVPKNSNATEAKKPFIFYFSIILSRRLAHRLSRRLCLDVFRGSGCDAIGEAKGEVEKSQHIYL